MKRNHKLQVRALCLAALALLLVAGSAQALEEERRVVKKVQIRCDDGDCEHVEHEGADGHAMSWFSGDGPGRFAFRMNMGGGYLGVQLTELTPELRTHFGVGEDEGVMISKIVDDSPAQRAGLEVGDIVTAADSERVGSGHGLARLIRGKEDGESVLLEVWRDGSVLQLSAAIEEREPAAHGMHHSFSIDCEGDDCGPHGLMMGHGPDIECEEGPCQVKIQCDDDGDCTCTVDGEETDCGELHRDKG